MIKIQYNSLATEKNNVVISISDRFLIINVEENSLITLLDKFDLLTHMIKVKESYTQFNLTRNNPDE